MSAALALFDGIRRPRADRPLKPGACPLCGATMRVVDGIAVPCDAPPACRLGRCVADPTPGSPEHAILEGNRAILRDELVEVTFSIAAYAAATASARRRGSPHAAYLEAAFALILRRNILERYVLERHVAEHDVA